MHPRTLETLAELEKTTWFSAVGVVDTDAAIVLSSWPEAMQHCSSSQWENLLLEASNQYCQRLVERSKERFARWNEIIAEIKPVTMPLVRERIREVRSTHRLPQVFEDTVQWDVLHLCMEAEYADVYPPGFYASQAYWYAKGHFPCGWHGQFPEGMLIVY